MTLNFRFVGYNIYKIQFLSSILELRIKFRKKMVEIYVDGEKHETVRLGDLL